MEYSQTFFRRSRKCNQGVLILILMEYSQTNLWRQPPTGKLVLILILMEYSQTSSKTASPKLPSCLNPYSNGILTNLGWGAAASAYKEVLILILMEYSQTTTAVNNNEVVTVLILILMEYSQTPIGTGYSIPILVLILILMEYSQTYLGKDGVEVYNCLNPYSNGILTNNLSESELHFLPFIFSYSFSLFRQGVSPIRILFSQM